MPTNRHPNFRAIALAALKRARSTGESEEMIARWISEDINKALVTAIPAPASVGEWQDIASVPTDGTVVDLWMLAPDHRHGRRVPDAKWDNNRSFASGLGRVAQPDAWVDRSAFAIHLDGGQFTHWRPLPAPPTPTKDDRDERG